MPNITKILNERMDRKNRQQRRNPGAGAVYGRDGVGNPIIIKQYHIQEGDNINFTQEGDTLIINGTPGVSIYRQTFDSLTEWIVQHDIGDDPAITVWKGDIEYGYGTQPYGTSPYGGAEADFVEATHEPTIERIDDNNIKITWTGNESGRVVVMG